MSAFCRRTRSLVPRRVLFSERRTYATATQIPRPPPPTEEPPTETFSAPSKPKLYYTRPPPRDGLPQIQKRWPFILAFAALGVSGWAAFLLVAMNQERLSSSVVRQILKAAREDKALQAAMGDAIRFEPTWYLNGDPWISGSINLPQGNVDVSFRLKGHKGSGTLYFTSIRKAKGEAFTPLRFKVICDDGSVINIVPQSPTSSASGSHSS
ncbi:cytochrome oxidase complex assembly protein 1-domain-containing protein [Boletus edulis BED1]|uniref:Cytochrome oxidase complex assembly protein 1-domain-containing protein n=1 Tax=Boletus edulis BED1 TaxID=1328754 RepID=A0AAD4C3I4_BOLED|nr:cytochrome oxidase complex assembly protein 1-domain-containing protein [Boletus edulis BED1]